MPTNVVKTPEDEKKWQRAKEVAEEAGQADNYAYIMGVYKKMNPERFKTAAFRSAPGGKLLGFKVMGYDPDTKEVVSGANSRIRLKLNRGAVHKMPGKGIFLGATPRYVLDYYANHDFNALITYSFDPSEVTSGSLDDREPEITVPRAKVEKVEFFDENLKPIRVAAMPIYNSPPHIVADEEIVAAGKWQGVDEKLMDRAAQILQYHNERDAIKHLIKEGVSKQNAYFAVKAGKLLNKSRMQRRRVADCYIAARRKGKSLEELGTWPLSTVTIYRAVLASVTHFKKMDYVTRTERFAKEHADHVAAVEEEPAVVLKAKVKTSNVYEASNPGEWFYDGPPIKGRVTYRQKYGAAYPGNMGVMEMFQFQSQASTTELRLMERLLKRNKVKEAWELLKKVTGVKLHDPVARVAHRYAFNKYHAPELMSQLMGVLDKEGLDDAYNQIKIKKIPQLVDKAWKDRSKNASADRVAARHETKSVAQAISDALLHAFRYQEGIERGSHISRDGRKVHVNFRDESYNKYDDEDEDQEWELTNSYLKALRPILKPWMREIRRSTVDIGDKNTIEIEVTLK